MRSRRKLVEQTVLFRARMVSTDPDGNVETWYEGPFDRVRKAETEMALWAEHFRKKRPGWKLAAYPEQASMKWHAWIP